MSKIKFRLETWGKSVVFQVLKMDDQFRYSDDKGEQDGLNKFLATNGFGVLSQHSPCLFANSVYLQGSDRGHDNMVRCISLTSNKSAEYYCQRLLTALSEWAKNWEGWGDGEENEHDDDTPNVFEF